MLGLLTSLGGVEAHYTSPAAQVWLNTEIFVFRNNRFVIQGAADVWPVIMKRTPPEESGQLELPGGKLLFGSSDQEQQYNHPQPQKESSSRPLQFAFFAPVTFNGL